MVEFFRENSQWIKGIQMFFFLFSFHFLPKNSIRDFLGLNPIQDVGAKGPPYQFFL